MILVVMYVVVVVVILVVMYVVVVVVVNVGRMESTLKRIGLVHPLWNQEDCEFARNTLSSKPTTVELFQEIMSFKEQSVWFTYELLGFSHSDIEEVFDRSRISDNIRTRDVDGSWIKFETRSANNRYVVSPSTFSKATSSTKSPSLSTNCESSRYTIPTKPKVALTPKTLEMVQETKRSSTNASSIQTPSTRTPTDTPPNAKMRT